MLDPNSRNQPEIVIRTRRLTVQGAGSLLAFVLALLPSDLLAGDPNHPQTCSSSRLPFQLRSKDLLQEFCPSVSPCPPLDGIQELGSSPYMPRLVREGREEGWNLTVTRAGAGARCCWAP